MSNDIVWHPPTPPTTDEYGAETHPAYGFIGASRVSANPPVVLFDSDIKHSHFIRITLGRMTRQRELNRDWLSARQELVEVEVSEAQWASFVSSMNVGNGVPCTIRRTETDRNVDGLEYAPRLAHSMAETAAAADRAYGAIQEAMAAVDALDPKAPAKDRRAAMDRLRSVIRNATPNVEFAAESLTGHAENVVTKARADIEAVVVAKAQQLGVDPADVAAPLALTAGEEGQA